MTIESSNRNLIPQKTVLRFVYLPAKDLTFSFTAGRSAVSKKIHSLSCTGAKKACVRGGSWEVSLINLEFTA
jgi:hypothetical protein